MRCSELDTSCAMLRTPAACLILRLTPQSAVHVLSVSHPALTACLLPHDLHCFCTDCAPCFHLTRSIARGAVAVPIHNKCEYTKDVKQMG